MAAGIWTCPERVERGGVLVAFEGERMTTAEAERRGLLEHDEPAKEPAEEKAPAKKPAAKKAAAKKAPAKKKAAK